MKGNTENEIKKIKAQIAWCKGNTTKLEKLLNEQPETLDTEKAKIRLEQTEANLKKYNNLSLELAVLTQRDSAEDFEEEDEHEERTINVISRLRKLTSKGSKAAVSSSSSETTMETTGVTSNHGGVRLPEIEIPTYDGKDYTKYVAFMELFDAVIDSSDKLKPVQKLFYFKKYLKGEALALIEGLPLTSDSYVKARELLKLRYDNKFLVITNHIQALIESQLIVKGTASNLRDLVANTRQHIGALKALGQPTEQWDLIVLTILLKKVDQFTCRAYHQERDSDKVPTLDDFLSFVERRASSFEESQQSEAISTTQKEISEDSNDFNEHSIVEEATEKRTPPKTETNEDEDQCEADATSSQSESVIDYDMLDKSANVSSSYPAANSLANVSSNSSQSNVVDVFLAAIGPTLKGLSPYHLSLAKAEIFATVHKYELKGLVENGYAPDVDPLP